MAYGLSNGHVTNDVTWPWKVKLVTAIRLERNISKTAGFKDSVQKDHQYEMAYGLSNCHVSDRWRYVTPKVLWGSTVGYPSDSLASCFLTREATRSAVLLQQIGRPFVRPSVTLRYRGHIGSNISKIISWLAQAITLHRPRHHGSTPKGTSSYFGRNMEMNAMEKSVFRRTKAVISLKRGKSESTIFIPYIKSRRTHSIDRCQRFWPWVTSKGRKSASYKVVYINPVQFGW